MNKEAERIIHIKEHDLKKMKKQLKRLKELEAERKKQEAQILEIKDRYLRTAAEFDNYKKRMEKEKQDIFNFGTENFVMQLLPFDDIFESVIKQLENNPSREIIHQGMEMLKKEFTKLLENIGVKKIQTGGKKFNPDLHEASEIIQTTEHENGQIIEEERSGYTLKDKTLRPALVKVAKNQAEEKTSNGNSVTGKD